MAYPMSRAVLGTQTVPLPTSPVVWAGYVHKTKRACLAVALLWALAVSMLGFFSPLEISLVFEDVAHFVPALLFLIGVVGALALGHEINDDFKHVLGYGIIKRTSARHGHTMLSSRDRRLSRASVLVGLFAGCVTAAAIRTAADDWLGSLLLAGIALVLLLPTLKFLHLARIIWRQTHDEHNHHRNIVAAGNHSVATVVAVTNEECVVGNKTLFHVDLEYQTVGQLETAQIAFLDYSVWAPAVGNQFDVWFDPERPFIQDHIMIERRYVGQDFDQLTDVPVAGRHASDADAAPRDSSGRADMVRDKMGGDEADLDESRGDGPAKIQLASSQLASTRRGSTQLASKQPSSEPNSMAKMPQWMADETHSRGPSTAKSARRTRFLIGVPPNLIAVLALLGTLLVPSMVADVPWWTLAALWVYTALTLVNAAVYWQFMLRSRWFIRSGVSFGATEAAVFAGFFAAGFAMLTTHSMVFAPLNREIPWTLAHVLIWAAVIGALLVFEWAFTSNAWALRHLNAEFPAPPEVIQEALTTHDPDGIDKLESQYGYRAGVFLYA